MIDLQQAIDFIKEANPFMGELLDCEEPYKEYVKKHISTHKFDKTHLDRQKPYFKLIQEKISSLFPEEKIKMSDGQDGLILDTTAHHNILNYPAIIGAHITARFDTILNRETHGDYFVLDCGNVPFSEILHKRGVEFDDKHINLYPKADRNRLVSQYPLYKFDIVKSAKNSNHDFSQKEWQFLDKVQKLIESVDFSSCSRFSDQIVKINYHLWGMFFANDVQGLARRCVTLEHDEILITYLKRFFKENQDNFVWRSVFDEKFRGKVIERFSGIYGAWNYAGEDSGTYLFWGIGDDGKQYSMQLKNNILYNKEGKVRNVKLTVDDVIRALEEKVLTPAIFLKFSLVANYMGAKLLGGPGQTEYAEKLKQAWLDILKTDDSQEHKLVEKSSLLNFNVADVAYYRDVDGKLRKAWGFDMAHRNLFTKQYLDKLGEIPFKYLLYPIIPVSYYRLASAKERHKIKYTEKELYQGFTWV